jgi:hypothetical protein
MALCQVGDQGVLFLLSYRFNGPADNGDRHRLMKIRVPGLHFFFESISITVSTAVSI